MKPYWNEMMTPRPGLPIREVVTMADNVYIKDGQGQIWQFVVGYDSQPEIRLINNEADNEAE